MFKTVNLMKRRADLTHDQFVERYEAGHARLGERVLAGSALRYVRRYLKPVDGVGDDADFDAVMEIWYADRATWEATMARLSEPTIAAEITADEETLFDRTKYRFYWVEESESDMSGTVAAIDANAQLLAIEAIKQLKARYFRSLDTRDWATLRTVFCDDARFDARTSLSIDGQGESGRAAESNDWVYEGGDTIAQFIQTAVGDSRTVHHGHCHEIELLSPDEARGVIAMEDQIWDATGTTLTLHGCGHYHETYRRVDGHWRIHSSRISRLQVVLGG